MRTGFRHLHTVQIVLIHIVHSPCLAILFSSHGEFHVLHVYVLHIAEVHAPNREYRPLVCRTVLEPCRLIGVVDAVELHIATAHHYTIGRRLAPTLHRERHACDATRLHILNEQSAHNVIIAKR